mgnify:CR=1 FL=1
MPGWGWPTKPSASSMPCSASVVEPAFSEEKHTLPRETSSPLPSCFLSLSFAVMATTFAPASAKPLRTVSPRSSSGPVITTASPVAVSR